MPYKSSQADRQIGDRRGRNGLEARVLGPSSCLPAGSDLQDVCIDPRTQCAFVSITDRKDFYHQLSITPSKSHSNSVGPPVSVSEIKETSAYALCLAQSKKSRYARHKHGDHLGNLSHLSRHYVRPMVLAEDEVWVAFGVSPTGRPHRGRSGHR